MTDEEKNLNVEIEQVADLINKSVLVFQEQADKIGVAFANNSSAFQVGLAIKDYVSSINNEATTLKENVIKYSNAMILRINLADSSKTFKEITLTYLSYNKGNISSFETTKNLSMEVEKAFERIPDNNDRNLQEAKQKSATTMPSIHNKFAEIVSILKQVENSLEKSLNTQIL